MKNAVLAYSKNSLLLFIQIAFVRTDSYIPGGLQDDVVNKLALEISKDPLRQIVILTLGAGNQSLICQISLLYLVKCF